METRNSLFDRLGGSKGIAALVDDIAVTHMENPIVRARFLAAFEDPARLAVIKQHTVQFFEMGSGGPALYEGRSMRDTHRGMNVSAEEYLAVIDDIMLVLRKHGIDPETQKDVLAIVYSLKGDIVRQ